MSGFTPNPNESEASHVEVPRPQYNWDEEFARDDDESLLDPEFARRLDDPNAVLSQHDLQRIAAGQFSADVSNSIAARIAFLQTKVVSSSSGSTSAPSGHDPMNIDNVQDTSNPVHMNLNPKEPLKLLNCTKSMKQRASNLLDKCRRLSQKVVALGDADSLEKQKKYFQFRLVGVDDIDTEMKKDLDTKVGRNVVDCLRNDVTKQLHTSQQALKDLPTRLTAELNHLADLACTEFPRLASDNRKYDIEALTEDQKEVYDLWEKTIKYNGRWYTEQITKMKAGLDNKVGLGDFVLNECGLGINNCLISCLDMLMCLGESSTTLSREVRFNPAGGPQKDQVESRQTSRSQLRRKKRQAKKIENRDKKIEETRTAPETGGEEQSQGQEGQAVRKETSWQKSRQKVFVNVVTKRVSVPSYVLRMLNLGANFQLASFPQASKRLESWQKTTTQVMRMLRETSRVNEPFFNLINKCIIRECILNEKFVNKVYQGRQFRQVCKYNKLIESVFKFCVNNELYCILADKNLGLSLVDKSWYHEHMQAHFNRSDLFEEIVVAPEQLRRESTKLQLMLISAGVRYDVAVGTLTALFDPNMTQVPQAYGLIKLHKTPHKLRIITPVVNWINVNAARFVARKLQPYVDELKHVLGNSMGIARDLSDLPSSSHCVMSYDVCDMYNSISQESCLAAIEVFAKHNGWYKYNSPADKQKWYKIFTLCRWVFSTSYVGYGGNTYLQKKGLPMGSPLSPVLANLYMAALEDDILYKEVNFGIIYFRYLDDILMISTDLDFDVDDWEDVHPMVDTMERLIGDLSEASHGCLQFEETGHAYHAEQCVEFLDLEISVTESKKRGRVMQSLDVKVYDKPTNLHIYTDPSTFYPFHYVYNWIQGENIRLIRNSSSIENYEWALNRFKQFLFRRNYCESFVERFCTINNFEDRGALLDGLKPHQQRNGLGTDVQSSRFVSIRNEGSRLLVTRGIKILNNLLSASNAADDRVNVVVSKGQSILSVMNKTRKI